MGLDDVKRFFESVVIDSEILVDKATVIVDFDKFHQSHLAGINSNSSINVKNIYYHRLLKVMEIIKQSELVNLKQKVVEKFSPLPPLEKKNTNYEVQIHDEISENNLDFSVFENNKKNSVIKPNNDFEKGQTKNKI